jgi:hypothetical protein
MAAAKKTTTKKTPAKAKPKGPTAAEKKKAELVAQAEKTLAPIAKEINVRMDKAAKIEGQADDHRLAASLKLASAEEECAKANINFKKWCEANITQSYETIRKLVPVGKASDPAKAIADLRAGNAARNKAHRAKKAKAVAPKALAPKEAVSTALAALDEKKAAEVLGDEANARGLAVVSKADVGLSELAPLELAKFAFDELSATARIPFFQHVIDKAGVEITLLGERLAA